MVATAIVVRVLAGLCVAGLLAVPLVACERAPAPAPSAAAPQPVPTGAEPVGVELVRSGGIAGTTATVTVDQKGAWTYTSGGRTERGTLAPEQAGALWRLVNDPKLITELKRAGSPPSCSDGFGYVLVAGERRIEVVDCGTLPATVKSVVTLLTEATPL